MPPFQYGENRMLSKYRMGENGQELTEDNVRDIIKVFYPDDSQMQTLDINDDVVQTLWEMIQASRQCSRAMDFVPKPVGTKPGAFYIATSLIRLAVALTGKSAAEKRNIFILCKNVAGGTYKTDLALKGGGY
jgi:hypothetical protein